MARCTIWPTKTTTFVVAGLLLLVVIVGCKRSTPGADEKKPAPDIGRSDEIPPFKRANGEIVHSAGGKPIVLPTEFPDDVPRYPKAVPTIAIVGDKEVTVILTTSDAAKKIETFYREQLKQNGWKTTADKPQLSKIDAEKGGISLTVIFPEKPDDKSVHLIVRKKKQIFD
jgi:hypothetical protein